MDLLDDGGASAFRLREVRFEVVDVHPGNVCAHLARPFTIKLENEKHCVTDTELDPRVAVGGLGQRVESFRKIGRGKKPEHVGEPSRRRGRTRVRDTERQAGNIDLLVRYQVSLGTPCT